MWGARTLVRCSCREQVEVREVPSGWAARAARPPQMGDVRDDALHLGSGLYYGIAR